MLLTLPLLSGLPVTATTTNELTPYQSCLYSFHLFIPPLHLSPLPFLSFAQLFRENVRKAMYVVFDLMVVTGVFYRSVNVTVAALVGCIFFHKVQNKYACY